MNIGGQKKNCSKCDYVVNDALHMKRNMRDEHNIKTDSTSPPPKKQKKSDNKIVEEPMDTESDTVTEWEWEF